MRVLKKSNNKSKLGITIISQRLNDTITSVTLANVGKIKSCYELEKKLIGLFVIVLLISSCISGDGTLRCYSRLVSDSTIVRKTLYEFWNKYPENRLDEATLLKLEKFAPNRFKGKTFIDSSKCNNCRSVLRSYVRNGDFQMEEWYIKSSNNEMVFRLGIANVGAWINGFTCDLCLKYVMYLDEREEGFKNWELSKGRKKHAREVFEKDVLPKLKRISKTINVEE